MRSRVSLLAIVVAATCLGAPPASGASTTIDVRGTWSCASSSSDPDCYYTIADEDMAAGTFSGTGGGAGYTWHVTGTLDGSRLEMSIAYDGGSFHYWFDAVMPADGSTMSGHYGTTGPCDANPCDGTYTYTRKSGPPGGGDGDPGDGPKPNPDQNPSPDPTPAAKRPSATQVTCNLDVHSGIDTCGAQVADAGPRESATPPTGTVAFATVPGTTTRGLFLYGPACTLSPTPGSSNVSFCSVQFQPETTDFSHVEASYGGDDKRDASAAETAFLKACVTLPSTRAIGQGWPGDTPSQQGGGSGPGAAPCAGLPKLPLGYLDEPTPSSREFTPTPTGGACPPGYRLWNGRCVQWSAVYAGKLGASASAAAPRGGTTVTYRLMGPAAVRFTVARLVRGRRGARGRCVAQTRRNRRARACTRRVAVRGGFTIESPAAGVKTFLFTGWIGRRRLAPGAYVLVASPSLQRSAGTARAMRFRIVTRRARRG